VPLDDDDYGELLSMLVRIMRDAVTRGSPVGSVFRQLMTEHLRADPAELPIVSETYAPFELPNLHLALEAYVSASGRSAEQMGILGGLRQFMGLGLRDLIVGVALTELAVGPVEYETRPVGVDSTLPCVALGLYLVKGSEGPLVMFVHREGHVGPRESDFVIEVVSATRDRSSAALAELRRLATVHNVYRGQMITVGQSGSPFGPGASLGVTFHRRPSVSRDDIVLPQMMLERIERRVVGIGRSAASLRAAGRHVRRGLLLHGPPGTGKTLTVRYLAAQLSEATVIVLSGTSIGAVATSCAMARDLAPALVVVEDVDLVAQERSLPGAHGQPLLFQLMNEIDGITEDADVAFILTTNRPELLEPALAARPGRVDLAVGLELPDGPARRQLINLYGRGLDLAVSDWSRLLERTEGTSPAFIKEWLRAAVLRRDPPLRELTEDDLHDTLDELLADSNRLTRILLGGASEQAAASGLPFPPPGGLPSRLSWLPDIPQLGRPDLAEGPIPPRRPASGVQPGQEPDPFS
jgi:hypothetical protein